MSKARFEEQEIGRKFIQRLFPEVQKLGELSQNQWFDEVEKLIKNHLQKQHQPQQGITNTEERPDVAKLQAQIVTYKNIIDDTVKYCIILLIFSFINIFFQEGMLNKLQQHIEQQEINWRSQLKAKEDEVDSLRINAVNQLQNTVTSLEKELASAKEESRLLQQELESFKSGNTAQNDSTALVERLSEVTENNVKKQHNYLFFV